MNPTHEDILAQVREARELSSRPREVIVLAENQQNHAKSADFFSRPREVYKDKNIKIQKDVSREPREENDKTCPSDPLGERTSFSEVSPEGLGKVKDEEGVMMSPAARTSSRTLSAITAQHHRTVKGLKVSMTLQHQDEAEYCAYIELTAELKRSDRIRELKAYAGDSDEFTEFYSQLKKYIRDDLLPEEKKHLCLGRLHERGKRSKWIADMIVVGHLDHEQRLKQLIYYYADERYEIPMNQPMSARQQELYLSNGIYGELKRQRTAPTLDTLKRKYF